MPITLNLSCQLKTSAQAFRASLLALFALGALGCSDSDTLDNINDPDLITPIEVAFVHQGQLYEYDRLRQQAMPVLDTQLTLFTGIDNDTTAAGEDFAFNTVDYRNAMPEFVIYKNGNRLEAFELSTRHVHTLYDFASEDNPNGREQICDLRPVRVPDTAVANNNKLVVIDERAVHVKAATDCADEADARYYKMTLVESGKTYLIRLLKIMQGESQVSTETKPEFEAFKLSANEAQMYEQGLLVDFANDQFGRYGIDSNRSELVFHSSDQDLSEAAESELWRLYGSNFSDDAKALRAINPSRFFRDHSRVNSDLINNQLVVLNYGQTLVQLSKANFFEDDAGLERMQAISSPLYRKLDQSDDAPLTTLRPAQQLNLFVIDGQQLQRLALKQSAENQAPSTQIGAAERYDMGVIDDEISVLKHFDNGENALVSIKSGIETTKLIRSSKTRQLMLQRAPTNSLINEYDSAGSRALALGANNKIIELPNAFFIDAVDERFYFGHDQGPSYTPALVRRSSNAREHIISTLNNQNDSSTIVGEQLARTKLTLIPHPNNKLRLINDDFALLVHMVATDQGQEMKHFYFDPIDKFKTRPSPFEPLPVLEEIPLP